jgi:hypothetical protein
VSQKGTTWRSKETGPVDHDTRGKTAHQRLRRLDQFLMAFDPTRLRQYGVVVDLGYGRVPVTTVEWFQRLRNVHPKVRMVGVERDPERVAAAQSMAEPGMVFRKGDFQLPMEADEPVLLMRAMNVLRQYEQDAALSAHEQLLAQMANGGLLAEGTCDPSGRTMVVQILRRTADGQVLSEGLLFACSFHGTFEPKNFQAVLPKHLIHRMQFGEPIEEFFMAWNRAAARTRSVAEFGQKQFFVAAAEALANEVSGIETRRNWLRNGWLFWRGAPYP